MERISSLLDAVVLLAPGTLAALALPKRWLKWLDADPCSGSGA